MDASKRMVNLFFAAATIIAWVVFAKAFQTAFAFFGARDAHLLGKEFTTSTLLAAVAALALLFWAWRHERIRPLSYEVADELVKVVWPSWEETRSHSKVVIIVTLIISTILWVFDQVFGHLTSLILGGGSG